MSRGRGMRVAQIQAREAAMDRMEPSDSLYHRIERNEVGEAVLNPELISIIEMLLLEGNTRANAARVVGLQRTTLQKWMAKGRQDILDEKPSLYAKLVFVIDRCEGEQERRLVHAAFRAALATTSDGGMALKLLERRNPDDWAPALPDTPETAAQFASLTAKAVNEEAQRVLKQLQRVNEVTVTPVPDAEVVDKPE